MVRMYRGREGEGVSTPDQEREWRPRKLTVGAAA